jgi:hypothetical protein
MIKSKIFQNKREENMANIFNNEKIKKLCLFFILLLPFVIFFPPLFDISLIRTVCFILFLFVFNSFIFSVFSENSKFIHNEKTKENVLFIILISSLIFFMVPLYEFFNIVVEEVAIYFILYNGLVFGLHSKNPKKAYLMGFLS